MKKFVIVILLFAVTISTGCSDIIMTAECSQLFDEAAAWADTAAAKAESGTLTPEEMVIALRTNATHFQKFRNIRDNKPSESK